MNEIKGDMWVVNPVESVLGDSPRVARVITTNGFVKKNGECVMGAGVALQAKKMNTWLPKIIGEDINKHGNNVFVYDNVFDGFDLITFPVKHAWWEKANLALIRKSAIQLRALTKDKYDAVVMPKPGCGNGKLNWSDVRPILLEELVEPIYCVCVGRE